MTETVKLILQIVIEGATVIGLIIALAKTIIKAIKEKNWKPLLTLAMKLMAQAEESIENGSDRKKFVIEFCYGRKIHAVTLGNQEDG